MIYWVFELCGTEMFCAIFMACLLLNTFARFAKAIGVSLMEREHEYNTGCGQESKSEYEQG